MILTIKDYETVLRTKSVLIVFKDEHSKYKLSLLIDLLEQELRASKTPSIGLSAIQIGIRKRVSIIRMPNLKLNLFNPEIILKDDPRPFVGEACLSIPGKVGTTLRYNHIIIRNDDGKLYDLTDLEAIVVQHEIDHLNGTLYIDRLYSK